jgi:hypothetical protein
MREISVTNTIRMWDTYLVSNYQTHISNDSTLTLRSRSLGRRHRRVLTISPLRLLSLPGAMERTAQKNGFPGKQPPIFSDSRSDSRTGHYHVLAVFANTGVG